MTKTTRVLTIIGGSVQNAQQLTSQLHQREAAVQTAQHNPNLAQRQVESAKAQRMSGQLA